MWVFLSCLYRSGRRASRSKVGRKTWWSAEARYTPGWPDVLPVTPVPSMIAGHAARSGPLRLRLCDCAFTPTTPAANLNQRGSGLRPQEQLLRYLRYRPLLCRSERCVGCVRSPLNCSYIGFQARGRGASTPAEFAVTLRLPLRDVHPTVRVVPIRYCNELEVVVQWPDLALLGCRNHCRLVWPLGDGSRL